jgi:hypothetical protein
MTTENVDLPQRRPYHEALILSCELDRGTLPDGYRVELIERGG